MSNPPTARQLLHNRWFVPCALAAVCFAVYGSVLIHPRGILSIVGGDVATQFLFWRQFGFSNLRHGHIPLWNPHIYCGVPFFGGWQSGLLYPLNWIYLFLPLNLAITIDAVLSTYLTGLFAAMLARRQGFHPLACLLTGVTLMLGGAFFAHVWPGHLSALEAMAWTPLVLLAVDEALDRPGARPALLGALAIAMQILAGHPQTVYNTALVIGVYAVIRLVRADNRARVVAALVAMPIVASLLTAVQLLTGIEAASEGLRNGKPPFDFVAQYSFPPESLVTMLAPFAFGDMAHVMYWGRWEYWEASGFVGVASLFLALIGWRVGRCERRGLWAGLALLSIAIAMGKYTPLLHVMYAIVPGIAKFRSHNRFFYEATLFLALLAGAGLDALLRGEALERAWAWSAGFVGALLACAAFLFRAEGARVIQFVRGMGHVGRDMSPASIPHILHSATQTGFLSLLGAAIVALCVGAALALRWRSARWVYAIAAIAMIELVGFARAMVTTFDPAGSLPQVLANFYGAYPGDYRVQQIAYPLDSAIGLGAYDIWGYDPIVQRRYSELMTAAQGGNPDQPSMFIRLDRLPPLAGLFRCRYTIAKSAGHDVVRQLPGDLPHGLIVYSGLLARTRAQAFNVLLNPSFTGRDYVVLDRQPSILPGPPTPGSVVTVKWQGSDTLRIDAFTMSPGILLITDSYSRFWTAEALPGSTQQHYDVLPGNYAQIAVPVQSGNHQLTLTYRPPAFRLGAAISLLTLCAFLAACVATWRGKLG